MSGQGNADNPGSLGRCEKCGHDSHSGSCRMLMFWDRPGGTPGNGYCPCSAVPVQAVVTTFQWPVSAFPTGGEYPDPVAELAALRTKAALADRLLACLKQSRRTLWECAEDTAGTLTEALFREDVAQCDALIAEAEALGEPK